MDFEFIADSICRDLLYRFLSDIHMFNNPIDNFFFHSYRGQHGLWYGKLIF